MNRKNRFVVLFSLAAVLALLAACGAPQPTATVVPTPEPAVVPTDTPHVPPVVSEGITVTFDGDRCVYEGPDKVAAGQIPVVLDVEDQKDHEAYGLAVLTLDEGKTFEDLDAWPSTDQPPWTHLRGLLHDISQGRRAQTMLVALEGPLFVVCFTGYPVTKSDTLGPIQIEPANWPASAAAFPTGSFAKPNQDDYYIEFTDDGKFVYHEGSVIRTSGRYSVQGNVLTWETDSYCDDYDANPATYEWTYENGVLAFILKGEDRCPGRMAVLHLASYVKAP